MVLLMIYSMLMDGVLMMDVLRFWGCMGRDFGFE